MAKKKIDFKRGHLHRMKHYKTLGYLTEGVIKAQKVEPVFPWLLTGHRNTVISWDSKECIWRPSST